MLSAKQTKKKTRFPQVSSHRKRMRQDENRGRVSPTHYFTEQMSCTLGFSKTGCSDSAGKPHTLSEKSPRNLKPDVSTDVK